MATLENTFGGSLQGSPLGAINILERNFGTGLQRQAIAGEQQRQEDIQGLTEEIAGLPPGSKRAQAALVRLTALDPQVANSVRGVLNRGDRLETEALMKEIEEVLKYFFKKVKCKVFGLSKSISLYRYYECRNPRIDRCCEFSRTLNA